MPDIRFLAALGLQRQLHFHSIPDQTLHQDILKMLAVHRQNHAILRWLLVESQDPQRGVGQAIWLLNHPRPDPVQVETLVRAGQVALARRYVSPLRETGGWFLKRMARTGLVGHGEELRYAGRPEDVDLFPLSRPLVVWSLLKLAKRGSVSRPLAEKLYGLLLQLEGADRQAALMVWTLVAWRLDGEEAAWRAWRAIRYKSRRIQALQWLAALARRHREPEAEALFLGALPAHRHAQCETPYEPHLATDEWWNVVCMQPYEEVVSLLGSLCWESEDRRMCRDLLFFEVNRKFIADKLGPERLKRATWSVCATDQRLHSLVRLMQFEHRTREKLKLLPRSS